MVLFRLPLFAGYRFVGNSDRWNHYLSFAAFHSDNFSRGTFSAWCDYLFMGFDSLAQPFSFVSPLFALPALLGTDDVIRVFGYVSPVILVATLSTVYLVLYSFCRDRLAAVAGACIYGLSTWSLLKLTQNDNSYLAVFVSPILFYLVHTTDSKNLGRRVAVLTIIVWICLYWSFLNYFAYLPIFLFAYAAWRWYKGARQPFVALAASMAIATILAVPRLLVLFESLKGSTRTAGGTSEYVGTVLFLRYLDGNIFGDSWRQASPASQVNLSEGNLLFASVFASLLLLFIIVRGRYRAKVGSESLQVEVSYGFFVAFIIVVFLVIHVPSAYHLFALLFLNVSFLHTRFALAALFPIALISSLWLARPTRNMPIASHASALALTAAILLIGAATLDYPSHQLLGWLGRPSSLFVRVPGFDFVFVLVPEVLKVLVLTACFVAVLMAGRLSFLGPSMVRTVIAFVIIGQATLYADHFLNGRHTRTYDIPFEKHDSVMATPAEFRPPSAIQIRTVQDRVDNEHYRTALICPSATISVNCSTGLGMTWRLRLVDGYLSGVPARYAALPWPPSAAGLRSIRFESLTADASDRQAPWKLLSLLNVRQAVVVTKEFLTNRDFDGTKDLIVVDNPSPYIYPRAYFSDRVHAVNMYGAVAAIHEQFREGGVLKRKLPVDYVEGPVLGDFDGSGNIAYDFQGSRAVLTFPSSPRKRFLVVNEAYDTHWTARAASRQIAVYPTNVVMRGVVVPERATEVTFLYRSGVEYTWLYLAGVLPVGALVGLLGRFRFRQVFMRVLAGQSPSR